jgi:hypothetical protein
MDKEERKEYYRKWYIKNMTKRAVYNKEWRARNMDYAYYYDNIAEISRKRKIRMVCEFCSRNISAAGMWSHQKTQRCIKSQPKPKFLLYFD